MKAVAQVGRGIEECQRMSQRPQIDLIAGGFARETLEYISREIGRERTALGRFRLVNRAGPSQLVSLAL
jgi:hypothetical protein